MPLPEMTKLIAGYRGYFLRNKQLDDLKKEMFEQLDNKNRLCFTPDELIDIFVCNPCQHPGQVMYALPYTGDGAMLHDLKLAILVSEQNRPFRFRPLAIRDCHKVYSKYDMLVGKQVISVRNAIHTQCNQPHE